MSKESKEFLQRPDVAAKTDRMMKMFHKTIEYHANNLKHKMPKHMEPGDLHEEGMHAIMSAIQKYDKQYSGGGDFVKYVDNAIGKAMQNRLGKEQGIPRYVQAKAARIKKLEAQKKASAPKIIPTPEDPEQ